MATYELHSSPETCHWGYFDSQLKPSLSIKSGDIATIHCVSGAAEILPGEPFNVLPEHREILAKLKPHLGRNIDNKYFNVGTTVYLPVFAEGGLFSTGDGHGVQGDGEVNLTALETSLSGTFRFTVRKDMKLNNPRAETATHWITHGFDQDLDDAAKEALRDMIRLISAKTGLAAADAYMLC